MEPSPYLLILFGSRAKDTARADSDWDVAVVGDHMLSLEERGKYAEEAARMLNTNEDRIDLADMGNASPLLQQFVAKEGKLLLGDPFLFTRFKVLAWKRYVENVEWHRHLQREIHLSRKGIFAQSAK